LLFSLLFGINSFVFVVVIVSSITPIALALALHNKAELWRVVCFFLAV